MSVVVLALSAWTGVLAADRTDVTAEVVPTSAPDLAGAEPREQAPSAPTTPTSEPAPAKAHVAEIPLQGDGKFDTEASSGRRAGSGNLLTYEVGVEGGVPVDASEFAAEVERTLSDPRGWTSRGWAFQRARAAGTRILLATPATTDRLCAPLQTRGEVSCRNGDLVVINAVRWTRGATSYSGDVARYRQYLINHEVGHRLGRGHETCAAPGAKAPVMAQQTKGLQGCTLNPWP